MESVSDRFLRYVKFDTQSDEFSETCPSTSKQLALGKQLVHEMLEMGISDARMDANGYVYGSIPGDPSMPCIGLIAHMDTSPDASGADIKARIVEYMGGDIVLNEEKNILMRREDYESLNDDLGKHLIVTDGTTLLGADDKAGIAEIMTCAEQLLQYEKCHPTLKIAFTPDEEIGRGADLFDVAGFGADFAYTVDGGRIGELEFENFNAAGAKVTVNGRNIHPGTAKNKMINSQHIAMEFHNMLPSAQRPEHTEGYEGFYHLTDMSGSVESSYLRYIIRDHDLEKFCAKKDRMQQICEELNQKYGANTVRVEIKDSYYNMREKIEPCMYIVERAKKAMENVGVKPETVPIRGGTDGARLSFMGLPCPNICTGGKNFHGRFEYIAVEDMELVVRIIMGIMTDSTISE